MDKGKISGIVIFILCFAAIAVVLFVPFLSLLLFIPLCVGLALLKNRFGWIPPLGVLILGAAAALLFEPVLLIMYGPLTAAFIALMLALKSKKFSSVPPAVMLGTVLGLVVAVAPVMAANRFNLEDMVHRYIVNSDEAFIRLLAQKSYDEDEEIENKLTPADKGYAAAARQYLAAIAKDETPWYLYYILGYSATFAFSVAFITVACLKRLKHGFPDLKLSDVRLQRSFLVVVVGPVLVFSLFSLYPPFRPLTATTFNFMVTVPCAFTAFTLFLHTVLRGGRGVRIGFGILLGVIAAAGLLFSYVLLALSFFGFADCILNVRKMLDYALKKPEKTMQ